MKKLLAILLATMLTVSILSGCTPNTPADGSKSPAAPPPASTPASDNPTAEEPLKIVLLISGTLGDKSFFDAANVGMQKAESELGTEIKVIEMGVDKTKYEPTFRDICAQDWDLIISGGPDMSDLFVQLCPEYPNQKFMNFDSSNGVAVANAYSAAYDSKGLSYLTGAVAALCTTADITDMNADPKIGFVGGMDVPGINEFLIGYIEGAKAAKPDIKIAISYAQDFANPGKGKELALNQYQSGADIVWSCAGGTGLGVFDAAAEKSQYAIGGDSDQAMLFADTDPNKAGRIITSAVKYIDQVIFNAIQQYTEQGTLPFGEVRTLSFKDGAVGLAKNEYYDKIVSADIKQKIDEIEQRLVDDQVIISSAIGMAQEELDSIRDSVKP